MSQAPPAGRLENEVRAAQSDVADQLRLSLKIARVQFENALSPGEFARDVRMKRLADVTELVLAEHGDYPSLYELCGALLNRLEWTLAQVEFARRPWWQRWLGLRRSPRLRV